MGDLKQVADRWDATEWAGGIPEDYWSHHPLINAYINAAIAPRADHMLDWLAKNYFQNGPAERALSLCCGLGVGDRQALRAGVCHYLEGVDISPASICRAQAEAEQLGLGDRVRYWVDDINAITLEAGRYDIAFSFGGLHHIETLERVCGQLSQTLKPDAYIFINEYVEPAHFQWTERQLDLINRVASVLPAEWRCVQQMTPMSVEELIAADPSEAVRSDKVLSILCNHFEVVDYCDYGGALLFPLWGSVLIPQVFMRDNRIDKQVIIKLLILMDELIAEYGIVPSNYAQLVLRNRPPVSGSSVPVRLSVHSPDRNRWSEMWLPVPTSWWQLPGKALSVLVQNGPRALIKNILRYLEWLVGPD